MRKSFKDNLCFQITHSRSSLTVCPNERLMSSLHYEIYTTNHADFFIKVYTSANLKNNRLLAEKYKIMEEHLTKAIKSSVTVYKVKVFESYCAVLISSYAYSWFDFILYGKFLTNCDVYRMLYQLTEQLVAMTKAGIVGYHISAFNVVMDRDGNYMITHLDEKVEEYKKYPLLADIITEEYRFAPEYLEGNYGSKTSYSWDIGVLLLSILSPKHVNINYKEKKVDLESLWLKPTNFFMILLGRCFEWDTNKRVSVQEIMNITALKLNGISEFSIDDNIIPVNKDIISFLLSCKHIERTPYKRLSLLSRKVKTRSKSKPKSRIDQLLERQETLSYDELHDLLIKALQQKDFKGGFIETLQASVTSYYEQEEHILKCITLLNIYMDHVSVEDFDVQVKTLLGNCTIKSLLDFIVSKHIQSTDKTIALAAILTLKRLRFTLKHKGLVSANLMIDKGLLVAHPAVFIDVSLMSETFEYVQMMFCFFLRLKSFVYRGAPSEIVLQLAFHKSIESMALLINMLLVLRVFGYMLTDDYHIADFVDNCVKILDNHRRAIDIFLTKSTYAFGEKWLPAGFKKNLAIEFNSIVAKVKSGRHKDGYVEKLLLFLRKNVNYIVRMPNARPSGLKDHSSDQPLAPREVKTLVHKLEVMSTKLSECKRIKLNNLKLLPVKMEARDRADYNIPSPFTLREISWASEKNNDISESEFKIENKVVRPSRDWTVPERSNLSIFTHQTSNNESEFILPQEKGIQTDNILVSQIESDPMQSDISSLSETQRASRLKLKKQQSYDLPSTSLNYLIGSKPVQFPSPGSGIGSLEHDAVCALYTLKNVKLNLQEWFIAYSDIRIESVIAFGTARTVYKAKYRSLPVAVKRLKTDGEQFKPKYFAEFIQEISAMFSLPNHPCITRLYGIALEGRSVYTVEELCPGGNLFDIIHNNSLKQKAS